MKRIFVVTAATFACAFAIGTGFAGAGELLDMQRITVAMEDQWQGYNYRNTMNLDKFVASLEDNRAGAYRNIHTQDSYIAALQDSHQGYYRNTHTQESFVAALGDDYTADRYGAIMDSRRFAGVLAEKHNEQATAAYAPRCGHRDIDYLATNIVLAKLAEACE